MTTEQLFKELSAVRTIKKSLSINAMLPELNEGQMRWLMYVCIDAAQKPDPVAAIRELFEG